MWFLLFLISFSSSSSDLSFQIIDDNRLEIITDDYPLITSIESPSPSFIDNRIIYFDEKNWTFVKLQIILKSAEGFLLSNQSYLIEKKKKEGKEEETKKKEEFFLYSLLSIFICFGVFGLLILKFKKNTKVSDKYIPNKEKDRFIANEFYET